MEHFILSEEENNRKLFEMILGDMHLWMEYKMKDKWHYDKGFVITEEELKKIASILKVIL